MSNPSSREPVSRAQEIQAMLARIPVALLETEGLRLLTCTRHVLQGRDLPMVEEPDNSIRAKIWLACVEQGAGAAGTRRPVEAAPPSEEPRPSPGLLKRRPLDPAGGRASQ